MMGRWVLGTLLVFILLLGLLLMQPALHDLQHATGAAQRTDAFVRCTWPLWDFVAVLRVGSATDAFPLRQRVEALAGCPEHGHLMAVVQRVGEGKGLNAGQRLLLETAVEEQLADFRKQWQDVHPLGDLWLGLLADYEATWSRRPPPGLAPWEMYGSLFRRLQVETRTWADRTRSRLVLRGGAWILIAVAMILTALLAVKRADREARRRLARLLHRTRGTDIKPLSWDTIEGWLEEGGWVDREEAAKSDSSEWFLQAQQMTVATFVHETLHEIKQPLTVVQGYVQLLKQQVTDGQVAQDLDAIEQQIVRLMQFVRHLNQFRVRTEERAEWLEVDRVLRPLARILEPVLARQGIAFELDLVPVPRVYLPAGQIQQLVWNLVVNAQEALQDWQPPEGSRGRWIRLRVRHFHPVMAGLSGDSVLGCGLTLVVEDNGPGIPESVQEQVLQPFYTTKRRAHVGLGLAICRRIVEEHGGRIEIRSVSGRGTTVRVWWPCAKAHPGAGSSPEQLAQEK